MKLPLCLSFLFTIMTGVIAPSINAAGLEVQGPCQNDLWIATMTPSKIGASVGAVTVDHFERIGIPFLGDDRGIAQIKDSPLGDDALIVVNETEMKSFGWCFDVDGETPGSYPHEVFIKSGTEHIRWYYAYAHYKDGEWIGACVPSAEESPAPFCKEEDDESL